MSESETFENSAVTHNVLSPSPKVANALFSLAEHSYCASINNSSTTVNVSSTVSDIRDDEQEQIEDLFEISGSCSTSPSAVFLKEIPPPERYSIELGDGNDEVNFDGFTYSIPLPISGDSVENTLFDGMSTVADININTVEIFASSSNEMESGQGQETGSKTKEPEVTVAGGEKKTGSYVRPRRRDFIQDYSARKVHFLQQYKKLTAHCQRTMSRTGCTGELSALFEGTLYDNGRVTNPTLTAVSSKDLESPSEITVKRGKQSEFDDHRYAATMLTQKVSSSVVRDHQYNDERTMNPDSNDSDDLEDSDLEETKNTRKRKRTDRYDYIKKRPARDQTFGKLAKSMFYNKITLEERTGALIKLTLEYDGTTITDQNYQNAFSVIINERKSRRLLRNPILAPKSIVETKNCNQQLTLVLPNFSTPLYIPPGYVVSSNGDRGGCSEGIISSGMYNPPLSIVSQIGGGTGNNLQMQVTGSMGEPTNNLDEVNSSPNFDRDANNIQLNGSPPPSEDFSPRGLLTFSPAPVEASPTSNPREIKDSATNTEPICSICWNGGDTDNPSSTEENLSSSRNVFWIRCNDPFCYDTVHASCVGFVITHASHLKQLPAFFCKTHRHP